MYETRDACELERKLQAAKALTKCFRIGERSQKASDTKMGETDLYLKMTKI